MGSWNAFRVTGKKGDNGIQGSVGADGLNSYFHVKYSDYSDGTNMNELSGAYIGTYVDNTELDSESAGDYNWVLIKGLQGENGTDGIPGIDGTNGETSYLHIKYSNDNGVSFTSNSGETTGDYLGQYVDFILEDSTVLNDYTWTKIKGEPGVDGIDGLNGLDGEKGDDGDLGILTLSFNEATLTLAGNGATQGYIIFNNQKFYMNSSYTCTTNGDGVIIADISQSPVVVRYNKLVVENDVLSFVNFNDGTDGITKADVDDSQWKYLLIGEFSCLNDATIINAGLKPPVSANTFLSSEFTSILKNNALTKEDMASWAKAMGCDSYYNVLAVSTLFAGQIFANTITLTKNGVIKSDDDDESVIIQADGYASFKNMHASSATINGDFISDYFSTEKTSTITQDIIQTVNSNFQFFSDYSIFNAYDLLWEYGNPVRFDIGWGENHTYKYTGISGTFLGITIDTIYSTSNLTRTSLEQNLYYKISGSSLYFVTSPYTDIPSGYTQAKGEYSTSLTTNLKIGSTTILEQTNYIGDSTDLTNLNTALSVLDLNAVYNISGTVTIRAHSEQSGLITKTVTPSKVKRSSTLLSFFDDNGNVVLYIYYGYAGNYVPTIQDDDGWVHYNKGADNYILEYIDMNTTLIPSDGGIKTMRILPKKDSTYDVGSTAMGFKDGYFTGTVNGEDGSFTGTVGADIVDATTVDATNITSGNIAGMIAQGQTWHLVSKVANETYHNTKGRPIQVAISCRTDTSTKYIYIDEVEVISISSAYVMENPCFIVPIGLSYKVQSGIEIIKWAELY